MAGKFFSEHRVLELHEKTVTALTKPLDGFDAKLPFSASRAKALLMHQVAIANEVADSTMRRIGIVKADCEQLNVRLARVEAICGGWPTDEGEKAASVYYSEDIARLEGTVKRMQQTISSLSKHIAAIDRKIT